MSQLGELVSSRIERLLPSQKHWLLAPERERIIMAGYRAGKTRVGCLAAMMLSYVTPDNYGFIGRASSKDMQETTLKTFIEVVPEEMIIGKPKRIGQSGLIYMLRSKDPRQPSQVYFDYIVDKQTKKSHLAGGNWGWFFVDQVEEIARADWAKLKSRLSRTRMDLDAKTRVPIRTHALGAGNQQGHDWIWDDFFAEEVRRGLVTPGNYVFNIPKEPKVFYKSVHRDLPTVEGKVFSRLGVITRAEENKVSNGGFVPDDYYDSERASNPPEYVARYLDGSFNDFAGKIYGGYNLDSVHNIEPFQIPSHWPWYCAIDPGGSAPWGIVVVRIDEEGNRIVTSCADELYKKSRLNPNEVVAWLNANTAVTKTRYVIDYQNVPVMQLFQDEGIHCEPAMKDVKVGLDGSCADFYINPLRKLPVWYKSTQLKERWSAFDGGGAPKVYVFKSCEAFRKEHDNYIWDEVKKNEPRKGQPDHTVDGLRYLLATNPQSAYGLSMDPYEDMRLTDPTSAVHLDHVQRELRRLQNRDAALRVLHADPDGGTPSDTGEPQPQFIAEFGGYF